MASFEDNSISYDIDYAKSKLKGKSFINYVYNIQIDINVAISNDISFEEKSDLILSWLNFRDIVSIDTLSFTLLNLLLVEKESQMRYDSIFTEEESIRFISENKELIDKIIMFMDSIILYILHKFDNQPIETFNVDSIDDEKYIPKNIVNIFSIKDFFVYYSSPFRKKAWFIKQFEDRQNHIIGYFLLAENNILLGFINAIINNKITPEDYCRFINA